MKTFEYRLFPNKEQQHLLMQCLVRTHICTSCGHTADRDVNAAKNILTAGAQLHPST